MVSRRALLLGGGAAAALTAGGLTVGRDQLPYRIRDAIGLPVDPDTAVPTGPVGPVVDGTLGSGARFRIGYPDGTTARDRLPVCIVLHGRGGDHNDAFADHALHRFLAEVVRGGTPPFALVAVDGGPDSYWHRRRDGRDPVATITELAVELARRGHPMRRYALSGWSMGGYGALLMAARTGGSVVAVVVANSPAVFRRYSDARPGAFDDEADHRTHDVFAGADALRALPVRITCGDGDPFLAATRALATALPGAQTSFGRGGHTVGYWRSTAAADLQFIGAALT